MTNLPDIKRRMLLISIILLFLIFTSYNFGAFFVNLKYNEVSTMNSEIQEVIDAVDNETLKMKLTNINEEIKFINAFCFEGDLK